MILVEVFYKAVVALLLSSGGSPCALDANDPELTPFQARVVATLQAQASCDSDEDTRDGNIYNGF